MNVLFFLLIAVVAFILAGRFYARFIARSIGEDPNHPTPAQTI
ncbi:hypothetical protein ES707_17093 [subsurface metagenome]